MTDLEKILVIKDGKQHAYGNFDQITNSGFNIEEILQSYNETLTKAGTADVKKFADEKMKGMKRLASNALQRKASNQNSETTDQPPIVEEDDSPNKIKEEELFKEEDAKLKEKAPVEDLIVKEDVDNGDVTI